MARLLRMYSACRFMTFPASICFLAQGCDTEAGQQHDQHECCLSIPLLVYIEYFQHLVALHAHSRFFGAKADQPPRRREKISGINHLQKAEAVKACLCGAMYKQAC